MADIAGNFGPKGLIAKIRASAAPFFLVFLPGCVGAFLAFALGQGAPIAPPEMLNSAPAILALQILVGGIASFTFVYVFCGVSQDSAARLIGIALIAGYGWNVIFDKYETYLQTQSENDVLAEKASVLDSKTQELLAQKISLLGANPSVEESEQLLEDFAIVRPFLSNPAAPEKAIVLDDQMQAIFDSLQSGAGIGGGAVTLSPETTFRLQNLEQWVAPQTWREIQQLPGLDATQ